MCKDPMNLTRLLSLWGKTDSKAEADSPVFHPAICHMIDIGLVAEIFIKHVGSCSPIFDLTWRCFGDNTIERWFGFFVALHDFGKLTPGFQAICGVDTKFRKNTEYVKSECQQHLKKIMQALSFPANYLQIKKEHGQATFELLIPLLKRKFGCSEEVANGLARAIGGHHGEFPMQCGWQHQERSMDDDDWNTIRTMAFDVLLEAFNLEANSFPFSDIEELDGAFLVFLAGLTSVADWIGSNENYFPYIGLPDTLEIAEYRQSRIEFAQEAIYELHLKNRTLMAGRSRFSDLFPFKANTTQKAAGIMGNLNNGNGLVIIETPMGSGKTEAALFIADRWIREYGAKGLYYALPTQATGNKMFRRIREFLQEHPGLRDTDLHLLHAFSDFQDEYEDIKIVSIHGTSADAEISAQAWFSHRKRGLLSPFAVGTVDQALMAVLQVRHMFVRLYALSGKVVIIDEVHAYDAYTSQILYRLLTWLGVMKTPVILLSATLPSAKREELIKAYYNESISLKNLRYPCVIGIDDKGMQDFKNLTEFQSRLFNIKSIDRNRSWSKATCEVLQNSLKNGGCAVCIMNSVGEAQELFSYLKKNLKYDDGDTHFILFHARFPMGGRLEIENSIDNLFGAGDSVENPNPNRPERAIVVGTQVLEQSLDVDFDWMLTDLAPIDLMLQRSGRLHRHGKNNSKRPDAVKFPVLYYLKPDLQKELDSEKPESTFGISAKIYEPAILLRTSLALREVAKITLPDDLQDNSLVEQVYGGAFQDCPDNLQNALDAWDYLSRWMEREEALVARRYLVDDPHEWEDGDEILQKLAAHEDDELAPAKAKAQTRLARPSIMLILLHEKEGKFYLDPEFLDEIILKNHDKTVVRRLISNSVTISNPIWYGYFTDEVDLPAGWVKSPVLRYCRPAIFKNGLIRHGKNMLKIDPELGLIFETKKGNKKHDSII